MTIKNKDLNIDSVSSNLFRLGLILTAVAMPLEIVPNNFLSLLSWVINVLLLQRAVYLLIFNRNDIYFYIKKDRLILAAFILPLLAIFISAVFSFSKQVAFLELRGLFVLIVRSLIIIFISKREDIRVFINSIYIVTAAVLIFALFQFYADLIGVSTGITRLISNYTSKGTYVFPRVHSVAHEPLYLANFLLIALGLISGDLVIYKRNTNWWIKTLFILSITVLILTVARGAIIGLFFGLIFLLLLCRNLEIAKRVLIYSFFSVLLSLAILGSATFIKKDSVAKSFGSHALSTNDESVSNRTNTWKYALKGLNYNVLTGVGGANSQYFIGENNPAELKNNTSGLYRIIVFNNSFITFMVEFGFIGLLSLIPLVFLLSIICRDLFTTKTKKFAAGIFSFFIAILLQSMTFEILLVMRFWMMLAMLIAIWRLQFIFNEKDFKNTRS